VINLFTKVKFFIGFLGAGICCFGELIQSQTEYPEITFKYDWRSYVMDLVGSFYFSCPVTEDSNKQLNMQLPGLIAAWERDAPILFEGVFSTFKRGIKDKSRTAIINLSHGSSYGSHRFLIFGLRWWVDFEPWQCSVSREAAFSALVFHELLHIWVDENVDKNCSRILVKYCNEDFDVLDHLHLMAIQKMVYININRLDLLEYISDSYESRQGPIYRRAWEIVNNIEGYEALLQDILLSDQCSDL
jgi:hypothetical protein